MFRVTYTCALWKSGRTSAWIARSEDLAWLQLKQRMGMHSQMVILSVEPLAEG